MKNKYKEIDLGKPNRHNAVQAWIVTPSGGLYVRGGALQFYEWWYGFKETCFGKLNVFNLLKRKVTSSTVLHKGTIELQKAYTYRTTGRKGNSVIFSHFIFSQLGRVVLRVRRLPGVFPKQIDPELPTNLLMLADYLEEKEMLLPVANWLRAPT